MSDFLKIGGKFVDDLGVETAKGIAVDADGRVEVVRHNETLMVTLVENLEKRDTSMISLAGDNAVDLSEWTTCCMYIKNTLDVSDAYVQFYSQDSITGTKYLRNADNKSVTFTLKQTGASAMLCTPDDFPILNYLRYFKCGLYFPTAPTSGVLTITLILKR